MGEGILKDRVPEAHTDYIIAIISEEYGSIISIMIVLIFLYVSFRIIKNCVNEEDQVIKISLCGLSTFASFSNIYTCWSKYQFNSYHRNDFAIFKLWWIVFNWKCNTCWDNIKLY